MRHGMMLRIALPICAVVLACVATEPTPPADLVGQWGGPGAELIARPDTTTLELACLQGGFVSTPELVDGRFEAPAELWSLNTRRIAVVRGGISGQFLRLHLTFGEAPHDTYEFVLRRGVDPDFGDRLCVS